MRPDGDADQHSNEEVGVRDPMAATTELTEHLGRLWAMAGEQRASVSDLRGVRARLFGYGTVGRQP